MAVNKKSKRFKRHYDVLTYVKHIASRIVKQSGASQDALWRADVASQSRQPHLPPRSHTPAPQKNARERDTAP